MAAGHPLEVQGARAHLAGRLDVAAVILPEVPLVVRADFVPGLHAVQTADTGHQSAGSKTSSRVSRESEEVPGTCGPHGHQVGVPACDDGADVVREVQRLVPAPRRRRVSSQPQ